MFTLRLSSVVPFLKIQSYIVQAGLYLAKHLRITLILPKAEILVVWHHAWLLSMFGVAFWLLESMSFSLSSPSWTHSSAGNTTCDFLCHSRVKESLLCFAFISKSLLLWLACFSIIFI